MRKGYLFGEKWYIKGKGIGSRGGASPYENLLRTSPGVLRTESGSQMGLTALANLSGRDDIVFLWYRFNFVRHFA